MPAFSRELQLALSSWPLLLKPGVGCLAKRVSSTDAGDGGAKRDAVAA
jgi:hypothetical protein